MKLLRTWETPVTMNSVSTRKMRKVAIYAALLALVSPNLPFADEYATTERGQRVLLKSDGTWTNTEQTNENISAEDVGRVIREHCMKQWAKDFQMQAYCEKQQREGVRELSIGRPLDVSANQFSIVRNKCATEWPDDFQMREYCEQQQFKGIRQLKQ